jgi:prepilin-type processing-associated H-X9-DG protein
MSAGDDVDSPKTPPTLKRSQIVRPAEKIFMIDESSTTVDDGCWAPQNYTPDSHFNVLSVRHDKGRENRDDTNFGRGNVLFADGHADFIDRVKAMDVRYWDAPWDLVPP